MVSSGFKIVRLPGLSTNTPLVFDCVHDPMIGDSAAHGESHVVTPTDSEYVCGDDDLTVQVVVEKRMRSKNSHPNHSAL